MPKLNAYWHFDSLRQAILDSPLLKQIKACAFAGVFYSKSLQHNSLLKVSYYWWLEGLCVQSSLEGIG